MKQQYPNISLMQVLPSCYGGKSEMIPVEVAVKQLASRLSSTQSMQTAPLSRTDGPGKLAAIKRSEICRSMCFLYKV